MTQQATQNPLKQVLKYGQSLWYDGLIGIKDFEKMIREDGIRGATTNPTIFEKALSAHEYDAEIRGLASTKSAEEIYQTLAVKAVQQVADVFAPVFRESRGGDGFVSIEVSPLLAYDTERTVAEALELRRLTARENVMIKVPATRQGIPAIRRLIAEGVSVNVTLIFSVVRYREVMDAYLSGLEDRAKKNLPVSGIASVASFFVSRVDTAVDKLLEAKNPGMAGKAAIANSKAAYAEFLKVFSSDRFKKLKASGASAQRPLWASTGTKNPNYSDVLYVEALIGLETVDTMPPATLDAFRDHGRPAARIQEGMDEAQRTLQALGESGIDLEAVTRELESAGVKLFSDSYNKIIQSIKGKIQ